MNRETNAHFAQTPTVGIGRSKFDRSFDHKTTFNAGELVPVFFDATIQPGDSIKMDMAEVVRMMTPITPVMDNANLDIYFFFIPYRLVWDHLKQFFGENDTAPWIQQVEYEIPQIVAPDGGWTKGSLADHFGFPTKIGGYKASALGFRSYCAVVNDWFRDQNLKNPLYIHKDDSDILGVDILDANLDPVTDIEKGACCFKVAKTHDYFTSCLPGMQKGPSVPLPLGDQAPIIGTDHIASNESIALDSTIKGKDIYLQSGSTGNLSVAGIKDDGTHTNYMFNKSIGLAADLSAAVGATVSALRQAFAIQRYYEKSALYGSRYIEFIKGHFQVTNPDFRLQRTEYLGGTRIPININQVVQTDSTAQQLGGSYEEGTWVWEMSDLSPQGNTAAYSLTSSRDNGLFTHSFTEHGIVLGLACVRLASHTYQQGLNRMWSRKKALEFYMPEFANLSNTSVLNKEIYLQGPTVVDSDGNVVDEQVFGYQECWADYRFMPDIVTGEMRSNYDQSLDVWHWADYYTTKPTLGSDWIDEDKSNFDRTLAVQDHDQFFGDFYFKCVYTRAMPLYSVPGLIDHH